MARRGDHFISQSVLTAYSPCTNNKPGRLLHRSARPFAPNSSVGYYTFCARMTQENKQRRTK